MPAHCAAAQHLAAQMRGGQQPIPLLDAAALTRRHYRLRVRRHAWERLERMWAGEREEQT